MMPNSIANSNLLNPRHTGLCVRVFPLERSYSNASPRKSKQKTADTNNGHRYFHVLIFQSSHCVPKGSEAQCTYINLTNLTAVRFFVRNMLLLLLYWEVLERVPYSWVMMKWARCVWSCTSLVSIGGYSTMPCVVPLGDMCALFHICGGWVRWAWAAAGYGWHSTHYE